LARVPHRHCVPVQIPLELPVHGRSRFGAVLAHLALDQPAG
jgi:hypothetical protein